MKVIFHWGLLIIGIVLLSGCSRVSNNRPAELAKTERKETLPSGKKEQNLQSDKASKEALTAKNSEARVSFEQEVKSKNIELFWQQDGQPKVKILATDMTGNTISGKATLRNVKAELYDKGKLVARLSAPIIEADEKNRSVAASGGVIITSAVPESSIQIVKSKWIKWYSREDKLVGNGGISAKGPVTTIDASAFIADTRLKTIHFMADPSKARAVIGMH